MKLKFLIVPLCSILFMFSSAIAQADNCQQKCIDDADQCMVDATTAVHLCQDAAQWVEEICDDILGCYEITIDMSDMCSAFYSELVRSCREVEAACKIQCINQVMNPAPELLVDTEPYYDDMMSGYEEGIS